MSDFSTGLGSPISHALQPSSVISAGRAAETHGDRMANGQPFTCPRGASEAPVDPKQCAEMWRAEISPCLSEAYGACFIGAINDTKFPEDHVGGKYDYCANPDCPNKGRKMALPAKGLCGVCYKRVLAGKTEWPPKPLAADPLEMRECPEEPQATTSAQDVTCYDVAADMAARGGDQDHTEEDSDLPEDLDRPFEVAGVRFLPVSSKPVATRAPIVTIRNGAIIAFSAAAAERYSLREYAYARLVPSEDRTVLGVKFFHSDRPGAHLVQKKEHSGAVVSARAFLRNMPGVVGKKAILESTEWTGFFVARFGGEAA